jgi:hypothetical protein
MAGISRYPAPYHSLANFVDAPDPIYGTASDGNGTISSNTTLTSDMFYNNLSIADNVFLNTAGYRLFVKNILTLGNGSIVGFTTGSTAVGSIKGGAAANTAVTNSLGGSSAVQTATAPTAAVGGSKYYQMAMQAIRGWSISGSSTTPSFLNGGAGGASGVGGGIVIVAARYISCSATTTNAKFSAPGTSGSGGGGGGVIIVVSSGASLPNNVSTDVTGGTGASSGTYNYIQLI